jgi:NLI interacting factor-like phosphatase
MEEEKGEENFQAQISYVLSKEECSLNEANHEIKVLELFTGGESNRRIEDCIIIDNNIFCY